MDYLYPKNRRPSIPDAPFHGDDDDDGLSVFFVVQLTWGPGLARLDNDE